MPIARTGATPFGPGLSGAAGRDAATALVCRGTRRALFQLGYRSLAEVPLPNGRRADLVALDGRGELAIVEVKSSLADWLADAKWPEYRAFCDALYFAVPVGFPEARLPEDCGLFRADAYGAVLLREAPRHPLAPARRKALTLRLALLGAQRLERVEDPERDEAGAAELAGLGP